MQGTKRAAIATLLVFAACNFQKPEKLDPDLERRIAQKRLAAQAAVDGVAELELAELYLEGKRYFDAAEHLQLASVKGAPPVRVASGFALAYLELGYIQAMVEQLKICFQLEPTNAECLYAFGSLLEKDGSESALQEARRTYYRFLEVARPDHPRIHYVRSTLDQLNARLKDAVEDPGQAPPGGAPSPGANPHGGALPHGGPPSGVPGHDGATGKEDVGELNAFGQAIQKAIDAGTKGDVAGAEAAFREALKVAPRDAGALAGLADTLYAQKKVADAKAAIDQAYSIDAKDPQVRYVFGMVYLEDPARQKDALAAWSALLQDDPGYATQLKLAERMQALQKKPSP